MAVKKYFRSNSGICTTYKTLFAEKAAGKVAGKVQLLELSVELRQQTVDWIMRHILPKEIPDYV